MRHNKETSMAVGGITLSRQTAKIKTIRGGTKTETVLDSRGVIAVGRQHNVPSLLQHLWAMNDRASRARLLVRNNNEHAIQILILERALFSSGSKP
jgi:hypothetical protein